MPTEVSVINPREAFVASSNDVSIALARLQNGLALARSFGYQNVSKVAHRSARRECSCEPRLRSLTIPISILSSVTAT